MVNNQLFFSFLLSVGFWEGGVVFFLLGGGRGGVGEI